MGRGRRAAAHALSALLVTGLGAGPDATPAHAVGGDLQQAGRVWHLVHRPQQDAASDFGGVRVRNIPATEEFEIIRFDGPTPVERVRVPKPGQVSSVHIDDAGRVVVIGWGEGDLPYAMIWPAGQQPGDWRLLTPGYEPHAFMWWRVDTDRAGDLLLYAQNGWSTPNGPVIVTLDSHGWSAPREIPESAATGYPPNEIQLSPDGRITGFWVAGDQPDQRLGISRMPLNGTAWTTSTVLFEGLMRGTERLVGGSGERAAFAVYGVDVFRNLASDAVFVWPEEIGPDVAVRALRWRAGGPPEPVTTVPRRLNVYPTAVGAVFDDGGVWVRCRVPGHPRQRVYAVSHF